MVKVVYKGASAFIGVIIRDMPVFHLKMTELYPLEDLNVYEFRHQQHQIFGLEVVIEGDSYRLLLFCFWEGQQSFIGYFAHDVFGGVATEMGKGVHGVEFHRIGGVADEQLVFAERICLFVVGGGETQLQKFTEHLGFVINRIETWEIN